MRDVTLLKEALPYLRRHRRSTMVVKLGGEIAGNREALTSLAQEVSLLSHVNIRVVVVHGGGPQATDMSRRLGLEPRMVQGRRVTDEETLHVAKMVFAGSINLDILAALRGQGIHAVGLSGVDADILHATRRPPTEMRDDVTGATELVDFGHVGDVEAVDTTLLSLLVENGYVPVVSSLAADAEGNVLNVNADTVASCLARDLGAAKLITMTTVPGLLRDPADPTSVISRLSLSEARRLMTSGTIGGGMGPKLQALVDAVAGGVDRGHILSGLDGNALLVELFTKTGVGTLVEPDAEVS